jgi:hypothetical protein
MGFWRWNSKLSSAEIRELVVSGMIARTNQLADGPTCSLFAEAQRHERQQPISQAISQAPIAGSHGGAPGVDLRKLGVLGPELFDPLI